MNNTKKNTLENVEIIIRCHASHAKKFIIIMCHASHAKKFNVSFKLFKEVSAMPSLKPCKRK